MNSSPVRFAFLLMSALAGLLLPSPRGLHAEDWPKDYVTAENSESPDKHYALLIPNTDHGEGDNFLADTKNHRLLGKIKGGDYFEHANHRGMTLTWADNSQWCVLEYDNRFGFASLNVLEVKDKTFAQTEFGARVQKSIDAVIKKQSHGDSESGEVTPYCSLGKDRRIQVRAVATTNPKELEGVKTSYAWFDGVYDYSRAEWSSAQAHPATTAEYNALNAAFIYKPGDALKTLQDSDKARELDELLNNIYQTDRLFLPPKRFAALKEEQRAWLAKRDAAKSDEEKFKLIADRIDALYKLIYPE